MKKLFVLLCIKYLLEDISKFIYDFNPNILDLRFVSRNKFILNAFQKQFKLECIFLLGNEKEKDVIPISNFQKNNSLSLVSIVLPVFNGADYLKVSIESCLNQTHKNIELIIVNDCSTDATDEIVNSFLKKDKRIKYIKNKTNLRLPKTLNVGFQQASGDFLTWTSHDNYYDPKAIEYLLKYLITFNHIDFVYSAYKIIDNFGQIKETNFLPPPFCLQLGNTVGAYFLYKKIVKDKVGDYATDMEYFEDYDYWVRVYKSGFKMQRLFVPYYYYRHHEKSMTSEARRYKNDLISKVKLKHFLKHQTDEVKH